MNRTLAFAILSASHLSLSPVFAQQPPVQKATEGKICSYDREALLALDQQAFDQDMNGGWRALARQDHCIEVAADLIRDYRDTRDLESFVLYWHEGQLRAMVGATDQAIQLFEKARKPEDDRYGWNLYVDATIAFLEQDRASLLKAREKLARLEGATANLDIVDSLIACFGRSYEEAYGSCEQ